MLESHSFGNTSKITGAFGIDLGTTNSAISVVGNDGIAKVIPLENGDTLLPSCVLWDGNKDKFIVGKEAYKNRYKPNACYSVKTLMGSEEIVHFKHGKKEITKTPVEVSALILRALVDGVAYVYPEIKDVVITVPAAFTTKQIEDTRKAAELADLNVLSIIKEPTAASLAYRLDDNEDKTVLVYDLGGGTFDVSIVDIKTQHEDDSSDLFDMLGVEDSSSKCKTIITVKNTAGDPHLGGDDLDKEILSIILEKLKGQGCPVDKIAKVDLEELLLRVEEFKKGFGSVLAFKSKVELHLNDGSIFEGEVFTNSDDFARATRTIYDKTKKFINKVVNSDLNIDAIVLVGGSTKNKVLQEMIARDYPNCQVCNYLYADEAVSLGASIAAKRAKFGSDDFDVFDVISSNIGVLAVNRVLPVIEKATSIPCTKSKVLVNHCDNQETAQVKVYEGSEVQPEKCTYLGDLLIDLPKGKAGEVSVEIFLSVDINGLLTVETVTNGKRRKAQLVNVLGKKVENDNNKETSVVFSRWYDIANSLENDEDRETLLNLIEKARKEPNAKIEVVKFLRGLKDGK